MNAAQKAGLMRKGELSPVENAKQFLNKINELDSNINAFLEVDGERVLREAKELENSKEKETMRLFGLCVAVKSAINVKGYRASCASKTLENYVSTYDADVIKSMKKQGAIVIGMTNCDEFCCGSSGETSAFGPTRNPRNSALIPGGSSSGSCAAVAAGMCDLALGSDTGGSIRNPASHCGVVGIKPTYGRVSRHGLIDLSMSLDQVGPIAPDVQSAALLLEAIAEPSQNDAVMTQEPLRISLKELKNPKIGLVAEMLDMCRDKRIKEAVSGAAEKIAERFRGQVIRISLPLVRAAVQSYYLLCYVEFFSGTRKFSGRLYGRRIEENCGTEVLRRILGGREICRAEFKGVFYRKALAAKKAMAKEFAESFKKCDFIISPVTPMLPHKIGEKITDPKAMYAYDAFTIPANLAGLCAGTVPLALIDEAPVGLQVIAPSFREDVLVSAMKMAEETINEKSRD